MLLLGQRSTQLPVPAALGSSGPHLTRGEAGELYLIWMEPIEKGRTRLQLAVLEKESWRVLGTIADGPNWFVNWADYPTVLALRDGRFAAHWLEKRGSGKYSYGMKAALVDRAGVAGKLFFDPVTVGEGQYTGFASLLEYGGKLGISYLGPGPKGGEEDKVLRFAEFAADGKLNSDVIVDADVCTCCQTALAITRHGPIIAYRDHDAGEIRDISVVSYRNGKWSSPRPVHRDGWQINACPVNGPAIAVSDDRVAVAWYTAAGDTPIIKVAFSGDSGETFQTPLTLNMRKPLGRVAVVNLPDGSVAVSWLEKKAAGGADLLVRRVWPGGRVGKALLVASADSGRNTGFPKMVYTDNRLFLAWTGERIHTVSISVPEN